MLRFVADDARLGRGFSRREWLRIGGVFGMGLLPAISDPVGPGKTLAASPSGSRPRGFGRAKRVIFVFASGGQSQIDTWDPKPEAPAEVRGAFASIRTAVPGTLVCEHLPRVAALADRFTIVRSMSHDDLDHGTAAYLTLTGRFHKKKSANPPPAPTDDPALGAILRRVRPSRDFPYDCIHVNGPAIVPTLLAPGQDGGFLGRAYDPLVVGDVSRAASAIPSLARQDELHDVRLSRRRSLRDSLDAYRAELERDGERLAMNHLYRQAFELLDSPHSREAFDLSREPREVRERYGAHRSGQACLLARRLAEAGVPLVTVIWNHNNRGQDLAPNDTDEYGWDTHNDIFVALRDHLLPRFDQSFSALIEDLDQRGMLDDTLVICAGEFGRAPLVALESRFAGSTPGRKHWANAYSIVIAGAGVARGAVVGSTDALGGVPVGRRITPCDLAATVFSSLGIDPAAHYTDPLGRPIPITTGQPIGEVFA